MYDTGNKGCSEFYFFCNFLPLPNLRFSEINYFLLLEDDFREKNAQHIKEKIALFACYRATELGLYSGYITENAS